MSTSLLSDLLERIEGQLREANTQFAKMYPGDSPARQPVHTVYGGAQIFKADTAQKLGTVALKSIDENAASPAAFAKALGLKGNAQFLSTIYRRIIDKLKKEPVEDFRIDFEDGYGNRPDSEEDRHAEFTAQEVGRGMAEGILPPFIGFRIKPLTEELKSRGIRTLDIFVTSLVKKTEGKLPGGFVVTIPKVVMTEQVAALVELLESLESKNSLKQGSLKLELMIETPQSIFNSKGGVAIPSFISAASGRCIAAHFGVYDYTASNNITAQYQSIVHPACDFARTVMKVSLAGTGVWISDGATNIMPVGPNRMKDGKSLSAKQKFENRRVVHRIWKLNFEHINHSLMNGFYQGWDLHPAQLPVRYAAVYNFFLKELETASNRLKTFMEKAAQATLIGDVFDDAATGQGLLNFFLQGIGCGAITEQEATATGLSIDEIRSRSFVKILRGRSKD
ncbi:MAG: phosphoenolpyruvate kinase [Ignavibacteriales bacterium]|nr:phosphoenolpyruvate kinase [Ignavibacteriales bacterium]